jgi:hypothetical protein
MKHVFGMAKSNFDLNGAKSQKTELDFLRLTYSVREYRYRGIDAQGYLLVMTQGIVKTVKQWISKYETGDSVIVSYPPLSVENKEALKGEKVKNVEGIVAGALGEPVQGRSSAPKGKEIGKTALVEEIRRQEPEVFEIKDKGKFPFNINWDFYGIIS